MLVQWGNLPANDVDLTLLVNDTVLGRFEVAFIILWKEASRNTDRPLLSFFNVNEARLVVWGETEAP